MVSWTYSGLDGPVDDWRGFIFGPLVEPALSIFGYWLPSGLRDVARTGRDRVSGRRLRGLEMEMLAECSYGYISPSRKCGI